ncbi:hypothetical protein EDD27_8608 [Nonomuraea polychroma]|uniref:Uncharacterized protein n=1 Tax=Nonomuraea polychroma TaxID=46176 RepID=A0A438MJX1_9ACTN|nr:hypothetical protein [Nonomuraea polychroma]RVX45788.1 hypothetical protein EDD27_8608 [Nonomuraea polychroma]
MIDQVGAACRKLAVQLQVGVAVGVAQEGTVMGGRWRYREDVVRMTAALRPALQARGIPSAIYIDNGAAYVDA